MSKMDIVSKDYKKKTGHLRLEAERYAQFVPKLLMSAHHAAASVMVGEHTLKRAGQGQNFWQFREYDIHDRPQDIDWRQSGKTDRVYVRERELQTAQTLLLWVDGNKGMDWHSNPQLPTKHFVSCVIACALSIVALRNGEMFKLFQEGAKLGRSEKSLNSLAEDLIYGFDNTSHHLLADLHSISWTKRSIPILISDFLHPLDEVRDHISKLAKRSSYGVVVQVLDPAEIDLPYSGRVNFKDPSLSDQQLIENIASVKQDYKDKIAAHRLGVRKHVERFGWSLFDVVTHDDLDQICRNIWFSITDFLNANKQ